MSESICLNAGFRHHIRFKQLKERLGKVGLGMYLELQDYVLEHCKDMTFCVEDEFDRICLDLDMTGIEFKNLYETVLVTGLGTYKRDEMKLIITLEKAKKHLKKDPAEATDINGTRASTSTEYSTVFSTDSPSGEKTEVRPFSSLTGESKEVLSTKYLPGYRLTYDQLVDDLQIAPCNDFEHWLKGEMRRANTPSRSKSSLGFNHTNKEKLASLMSDWGERTLLGAWRLFLYAQDYKERCARAKFLVSYWLNGKDQWAEKFIEFTGDSMPRTYEKLRSREKESGNFVELPTPVRSSIAESIQPEDECLAAQVVRRLSQNRTVECFTPPEKEGDGKVQ